MNLFTVATLLQAHPSGWAFECLGPNVQLELEPTGGGLIIQSERYKKYVNNKYTNMKTKTINQSGGVGFAELYQGDNKAAFHFFMTNAKSIKILTDNSVSSLTLLVEFNSSAQDVVSPYVYLNPAKPNFMSPVNKILLKIMPSHNTGDVRLISEIGTVNRSQLHKADGFYNSIEINSVEQIKRECDSQIDFYRESVLDPELPLVPICPAILYLENQISDHDMFQTYFEDKIEDRGLKNYIGHPVDDAVVIESFFSVRIPVGADRNIKQYGGVSPLNGEQKETHTPDKKKSKMEHNPNTKIQPYSGFNWLLSPLIIAKSPYKLHPVAEVPETFGNYSILAMEYLDGYTTLENIKTEIRAKYAANKQLEQDNINKVNLLVSLEVRRLHRIGYYHNDLHYGNIMINQDELFATQDPIDTANTGKVMIIDFGRVLPAKHIKLPKACKPSLSTNDCIKQEFIFSKYGFTLKSIEECVELMGKMQNIGESRKMAICSALGIPDCAGRSLSQVIIDELTGSPLILSGLSGGGRKNKPVKPDNPDNINGDPQLLRQVIINSLRQTGTYDELYQFLIRYQDKHTAKPKSPLKLPNTMKPGRRSNPNSNSQSKQAHSYLRVGHNYMFQQLPPAAAVSVMSGGRSNTNKTRKHKKRS